jgi:hypothetical protein
MTAPPAAELLQTAFRDLSHPRHALTTEASQLPDHPGLFAVYGAPETWLHLGLDAPGGDPPLYVGKTEARGLGHGSSVHFRAGRTAHSTMRRSFAALLRDALNLRGVPRNPSEPDRPAHFGLSAEQDAQLDAWLLPRLQIALWAAPPACADVAALEVAVIARWTPPLNLKPGTTTWRPMVTRARARMANDVRDWATAHGLSIKP